MYRTAIVNDTTMKYHVKNGLATTNVYRPNSRFITINRTIKNTTVVIIEMLSNREATKTPIFRLRAYPRPPKYVTIPEIDPNNVTPVNIMIRIRKNVYTATPKSTFSGDRSGIDGI